ncbi:HAD family hydrolase [Pseudohoeflea coraliihabitans]|uniref:HAD family phosphatase n=1 Tax=Pseudohoeflea coraliihabitans TaxID=2860393 RepID=A0ABS6WKI4_9HYPH|nr:HAD family phosphatase [Pseudohoeflea sp. DP4N28-3]MBW3096452.1 HAD family phosphatase [Pseudohoeflea sp. DP4N28-3]
MSVQAVAWDIDGTLVDSEPLHQEALMAVVATHGVDLSDLLPDAFVGVSLPDVWKVVGSRFPADMRFEDCDRMVCDHYRANMHRLTATPNVDRVMRILHERGIAQIAVSNSNRDVVDTNLRAIGVADLIDFSVSLDDVPVGKPDPAPYRLGAARLGLPAERILAVEDSATGLASARAAGMKSVLYCPDGRACGPADHLITEMIAILDMLDADS